MKRQVGERGTAQPKEPGSPQRRPHPAANLVALQRLAGNAAVTGLVGAGKAPSTQREPAGGQAAVDSAREAFGRMAEAAVGARRSGDRPAENGRRQAERESRSTERTSDRQDARQQGQAAAESAKTSLRAALDAPMPTRPPVQVPSQPQDNIAPEQTSSAIAGQAAAGRANPDELTIAMDEANGRGPESDAALEQLHTFAESHPGLVGLGHSIAGRIDGLRQRAVTNAQQASAELRGVAAQERGAVAGAIEEGRNAAETEFRVAKAAVVQDQQAAQGAVDTHGAEAKAKADQTSRDETARLGTTAADGRRRAQAVFTTARDDIGTAGQAEARRAGDHARQQAERVLALGRQEAENQRRTESDTDLAERKAAAVQEVAHDYAGKLREDAHDAAQHLPEQAGEAKEQVSAEEQPTVDGIGKTADSAAEGVRGVLTAAKQGIGAVVSQGHEQVGAVGTGVMGSLDNLHEATRGRATAMLAEGQAAVDASLSAGLAAHAKIAGQASQMLDEAGRDAITTLAGSAAQNSAPPIQAQRQAEQTPATTAPDASGQHGGDHPALGSLDQLGPGLDASATSQQQDAASAVQQAAGGARQAGQALSGDAADATSRLRSTAQAGLTATADTAKSQADATVDTAKTQVTGDVNKVVADVDRTVGDLGGSVQAGVGQATGKLREGADATISHANDRSGEVPAAMADAAHAQDSWLGRLGSWVSHQLSDTWQAIKGMADWRFVLTLVVGAVVAIGVGVGVALLIASAPFSLPALAVVLLVGAAAGAAGFAAAQITGNLLDPNPDRHWYDGVGHAAILGAFVGAAGLAATFYGFGLVGGTLLVMAAAGVGTVVANLAAGRQWDDHLVANTLIIGIFHGVIKGITDRIPSRGTAVDPAESRRTTDYRPPPGGRPEVVVDNAARIKAGDLEPDGSGHGMVCDLTDTQTGARYGVAEVELDANGAPKGGPHLTIDPTNATMPDRTPVRLTARGFGWTEESLRAALDAFRRFFRRGPANMDGLLAWKNLANFQKEFARIRAESPGLSEGVVAERAAKSISFGRHRIAIGYGDISVRYGNMGDVTVGGEVLRNVPQWVEVQARPTTSGAVPTVPGDRRGRTDDD